MSFLNKVFRKPVQIEIPDEYRDDYQHFLERKGISRREEPSLRNQSDHVEIKERVIESESVIQESAEPSPMDVFANFDMPMPVSEPVQELSQNVVTLDSVHERLSSLEKLLKERGYI